MLAPSPAHVKPCTRLHTTQARIRYAPPSCGDVGGLPGPVFGRDFVSYAAQTTKRTPYAPAVWGCTGVCYYRTAAWLSVAPRLRNDTHLAHSAAKHGAWAVGCKQPTRAPALALPHGATGLLSHRHHLRVRMCALCATDMDATAPALALLMGLRVWPWSAVSTRIVASGGKRAVAAGQYINDNVAAKTTRLLPQDRTFEHKCRLALEARQRLDDSRCGAG